MTDPIQHDPRTKYQIKEGLFDALYGPIRRRFKERIDGLIMKNAVLNGYTHMSFVFKNVLYTCDTSPPPRKMNRLAPQLQPEMLKYLKDLQQLNEEEIPYVVGYINQVLNSTNDLADYLRLLPPAVHKPVQVLIDTCPCKVQRLSEDTVALLQEKNAKAIDLMKQRMVTNLLLT